MAQPKSKRNIDPRMVRDILAVVCSVLIVVAAAISVFKYISAKKENQALEEQSNQSRFSAEYYEMNIAGEVSPDKVNLGNYMPVKQFGEFFINDNHKMLEQAAELTYNSNVDNKFFIKNNCYSCEINDENHYYFFGNDENSLAFYLKFSKEWDTSEWFVLKNFLTPDVRYDSVDKIMIIKTDTARGLPSRSLSAKDLRRINADSLASTTDKAAIDRYLSRYNDGVYVFTDYFDEVKKAKESSESGYVLASFKNYNLYQCIGTY